jgi:hypothetical protein
MHTLALKYDDAHNLPAQIIFGSPIRGCQGLGICKVYPYGVAMDRFACPSAPAWLGFSAHSGLSITFLRHKLSPDMYARHFASSLFFVEDGCPLPARITNRLGIPGPFTIGPGQYSIQKTSLCFRLFFSN